MLNADDEYTPTSLQRLRQVINQKRPLILWIGAGASRWAGLPSWHDSARRMRRVFAKSTPYFPDDRAESYINSKAYPDFFQLCAEIDQALFHNVLLDQFNAPILGPIYEQLIEGLKKISPLQIVTTNIDLCLEQNLGPIDVIERTDLERCGDSITNGSPFVAKMHGSLSSIASIVFTTSDYQEIAKSESLAALKQVFSVASVIFLGYGLQDEYVLSLLTKTAGEHQLFGNGPHFLITEAFGAERDGVYRIGYKAAQHQDHRAALTILNFIEQARSVAFARASSTLVEVIPTPQISGPSETYLSTKKSGFYISYFLPSGTHASGHELELSPPAGQDKITARVGLGFTQGELPNSATVAFHDLAVGLTCFDQVYLPLESLAILHDRATSEVFWALMNSGAINFVDVIHSPFFVSQPDELAGDIGIARIQDPEHQETRSSMSVVRKTLKPAPGKEEVGQKMIESLSSCVITFTDSETLGLAGLVRDALLLPRVSQLLGYSDYILTNKIPRWLAYPTLRFAHLVQTGLICNRLEIQASRVSFGGISLLSAAFSAKPAEQTVFDYASFVMAGVFGANLSAFLERNPRSLFKLIEFRETVEADALRREVSDRLDKNDGTEFSAAIEGSLKKAIPAAVLQAAQNRFSTLMKTENPNGSAKAVWGDQKTGDSSLRLWRDRSRELLLSDAKARGVRSDSPCLCGSGDRLRDCCLRPLR